MTRDHKACGLDEITYIIDSQSKKKKSCIDVCRRKTFAICCSIAEKSPSFYPYSNFPWHNFVSSENKSFEQITSKEKISKFAIGTFEISTNSVATAFQNHKNIKNSKSGQNWRFYVLIKQVITNYT